MSFEPSYIELEEVALRRVSRGASILDQRCPGWAERIDLETLDLSRCQRCIVGQLGGYEWPQSITEWGSLAEQFFGLVSTIEVGVIGLDYPLLTRLWRDAITARLPTQVEEHELAYA